MEHCVCEQKDILHKPLYLLSPSNQLYQHHSLAVRNYEYSNSFAGVKHSTKGIKCKKTSEEETLLPPPVTIEGSIQGLPSVQ
jgi:hypothetical protein